MKSVREGYKMTELGEIPGEWNVQNLSDICTKIFVGIATSTSDYYTENGVNIIRNQNIKNDKLCQKEMLMITEEFSNKNASKKLKQGDVITVRTGYPGITCVVPKEYEGAHTFTTLISRPNNRIINSYYLSRYMNSEAGINFFNSGKAGGAQQNLNVKVLETMPVILPTIEEQEKIALILSTVDEQIDNVDTFIEKNKELKKGLMQTLLTKGIGHTKFKKTDIGEIPEEWEIKTFKDISKVSQGLQIAIEERYKEFKKGRLPYITIQYINDKSNSDNEYFIENFNESVVCKEDDILMTRTGNTGIVVTNELGVFHNNFFKVDFRRDVLNKDFLVYFLNTSFMQNLIIRYAGITTIPDLKHGDFYKLPIVIPSLEEQEKIASILSQVDEKLEEYKNKKLKLEELKKGLMQQLLTGKIRVS